MLWAAGRALIRQQAPEADALAHQIAQGLGYLSMNMIDPESRRSGLPWMHIELAQLVGFEISEFNSG